jgi:hypothetical protein
MSNLTTEHTQLLLNQQSDILLPFSQGNGSDMK